MTKEEFEKQYAEKSGLTIDQLHWFGLHAETCDCGDERCNGWIMVSHTFDLDMTP
jgi:hypothetical protein